MLHNKSLFKPKAIASKLDSDCGYLPPLANIVQSYLAPTDYISAIAQSKMSVEERKSQITEYLSYMPPGECVAAMVQSEMKMAEIFKHIHEYLFILIENEIVIDINKILAIGFESSPESLEYFKLLLKIDKSVAAQCVNAYMLATSMLSPDSVDTLKGYIHELIESNAYQALSILLRERPELLNGEMTRNPKYRALDDGSKISNIDLAIRVGSVEALKVLLQFPHSIWVSGSPYNGISTSLDYSLAYTGKGRDLECVQLMVYDYLKFILTNIKAQLKGQKPAPGRTAKEYGDEDGGYFTSQRFASSIAIACRQENTELSMIVNKAFKLLFLPLDEFEVALEKLRNDLDPEEKEALKIDKAGLKMKR